MHKLYAFLLLVFMLSLSAFSQEQKINREISGKVVMDPGDGKQESVEYANISLLSLPDSTFLAGTTSDKEGKFSLRLHCDLSQKYLLKTGNGVEIREFFETMLRYRVLLDVYFVRILDDQGEVDYDLETPYAECEELLTLKMLEEMIYVNSSPMTYYLWFSELMRVVDKTEPVGVQELYLALKQFDDCSHPQSNITNLTYPAIDRYWFWRLDFHIWLNRDKLFECNPGNENLWPRITRAREVAGKYVFKRNRSIEHIAPQTPQQEDTLKLENGIRNSFGNLVMISSQQNSSLSNSVYLEKKARVDAHLQGSRSGSIESLKMLLAFTFYDEWNEKAISEHGEQAYEILKNSYK